MPEEEPSVSQDRIEPPGRVRPSASVRDHFEPPPVRVTTLPSISELLSRQNDSTGPSHRLGHGNVYHPGYFHPRSTPKPHDGLPSSPFTTPDVPPVDRTLPQISTSSEVDMPALSTLDAQSQPTKVPQDRSDREPSVERCVGCNEAWRRPIPDMDQGLLAPAEHNADYMRLASNMIDRLRDQRKRADAAYEEWKFRHSHCYRPASPHSSIDDAARRADPLTQSVIQSGPLPDDTPKKRRPETPHERQIALKRPKTTSSHSAEPLMSQSGQATNVEERPATSYDLEHIESDALRPHEVSFVGTGQSRCRCLSMTDTSSPDAESRHWLSESDAVSPESWEYVRETLPESCKWDIEYHATTGTNQRTRGCWTYASSDNGVTSHLPLTIANVPVVLPVHYRWPPVGGIQPPPDPRPSLPIDCRAELSVKIIQDIFSTFEGSIGFYLLINGLLQILVPATFDTAWASSHLPHKFGGLRVCYIEQSLEETMIPSQVQTSRSRSPLLPLSSLFRPSRSVQPLQINDLIEARTGSSTREKFSGRIGMKVVSRQGEPLLLMSSHVITAAILGKSFLGTNWNPSRRLRDDWNEHAEICAGGAKVG